MTDKVTDQQVADAAKRLAQNADYQLLYSYMAREFDMCMKRVLSRDADNELFIEIGMGRAFGFLLSVMRGEGVRGKAS